MITDRRTGLIRLIRESLRLAAVLFVWDVIVLVAFHFFHRAWMDQPALPFSLIGSALVLFLNVRNNAAYARWWEARTLWGSVINNARSFSRQAASLLDGAPELVRAMAAYAHALRGALRGTGADPDLRRLLTPECVGRIKERRNLPAAVLQEIGLGVRHLSTERGIHPAAQAEVDRILSDLSNAQGGLERIRNTPLAIQFSLLPRLLVTGFCLVLPLSMVQELGWIMPFGSSLVGFLFLALDEIGQDLEDPFRDSPHALPMLAMTNTIEIDLLQSIGDPAPAPVQPIHGVLP